MAIFCYIKRMCLTNRLMDIERNGRGEGDKGVKYKVTEENLTLVNTQCNI